MFKGNSIYESISLSSTVPKLDLKSVSDEELDPMEFISPESPELLAQHYTSPKLSRESDDLQSPTNSHILGDIPGDIHSSNGTPKLISPPHSRVHVSRDTSSDSLSTDTQSASLYSLNLVYNESPIQYLHENFNTLTASLNNNIIGHKLALDNGSDNLNKIRTTLTDIFHQLSENQYSLHELYEKESAYNSDMCKRFKKWDNKRTKLLQKIQSIKSADNEYGIKLSKLLDDNQSLDNDINELEAKLITLKAKKKLLSTEIDDTTSVLESKTSRFVKAFQELDKKGESAILDTLRSNGLNETKAHELIRSTDVNVRFSDYYKKVSESKILPKIDPKSEPKKNSGAMGMQANEPELEPIISRPDPKPDSYKTNSARPYDKGFNKGLETSDRVKQQLAQIYETYIKPLLEQNSSSIPNVDDVTNTITSKIDLDPILSFLESKVDGYLELSNRTGMMSTIYHKYGTVWKDTCSILQTRENELQESLRQENAEQLIGNVLIMSLNDLLESINHNSRDGNASLLRVIENEVGALLSALSMMPSPFKEKKKEYEAKFREKGCFHITTPKATQPTTFSDSGTDYLFNVSSNAIEHKVLPKSEPSEPKHQINKAVNNKLVKGE